MGEHTKRTAEFQKEVDNLVKFFLTMAGGDPRQPSAADKLMIAYACQLLRNNTTDSPCIVNAKEDEPIFVLRGQDSTAADLVSKWTENVRTRMANTDDSDYRMKLHRKSMDAIECAAEMRAYGSRKLPD